MRAHSFIPFASKVNSYAAMSRHFRTSARTLRSAQAQS